MDARNTPLAPMLNVSLRRPAVAGLVRPLTGPFAGWRMVLMAAVVVYCAGLGMTYGTAAFVEPLTADLDISKSLFTTTYGVATILAAVVLLIAGRVFDRYGSRRMMVVATLGLAAGLVWLSFARHPAWLLAGFAITRTFGQGMMPLVARILVPHWFLRQRGRAYSLLGIATTISLASLPPLHDFLLGRFSWQAIWRAEAVILAVMLAPLVWLVVRDQPEELGQHQDGHALVPAPAVSLSEAAEGVPLRAALRTFPFWALVLASSLPMGIVTGLSLDQVGIYADLGFPASLGATTFTIESAAMLLCTALAGAVLDRVPLRYPIVLSQLALVAGMVVLLTTNELWTGVLYAILRGAAMGTVLLAADVAWVAWYGRRYLGSIRSFAAAFGVFVSALGPIPFGFAIDRTGGYEPAIFALMALPVICAVMVFLARPPQTRAEPVTTMSVP